MSLMLKVWPRPKVVTTQITQTTEKPPSPELADVFRKFGPNYRSKHKMPIHHLKVMRAIEICRTSELGGHLKVCKYCGYSHPVYNSCGNRHCPRCQSLIKAKWVKKRQDELLPVTYYHAVFTLPHKLGPLARANSKAVYGILFRSVSETLLLFGKNELGGKLGFISILHTWDQKMAQHVHLHCMIPAGALSSDKKRWIACPSKDFLFSVKALSAVFKGKFLSYLKKAYAKGDIRYDKGQFRILAEALYREGWVVYLKKPFAGPSQVISYLGRYTHRVAISGERIKGIYEDKVTFTYRDRRDGNRKKEATLSGDQFIKRFLLHILPRYFTRIRHFGFLANRGRDKNIESLRGLFGLPVQAREQTESTEELMLKITGIDINRCPRCGVGHLVTSYVIARPKAARASPPPNLLYLKKPFAGPSQVISYLGRYTHRVAISNERIKTVYKDKVVFTYRDRRDGNRKKEAALSGDQFIKRFLLHILPRYFMRIRHFGFLANRGRDKNIEVLRGFFGLPFQARKQAESTEALMLKITGIDINKCPRCGVGRLVASYAIARPKVIRGSPPPGLLYLK